MIIIFNCSDQFYHSEILIKFLINSNRSICSPFRLYGIPSLPELESMIGGSLIDSKIYLNRQKVHRQRKDDEI